MKYIVSIAFISFCCSQLSADHHDKATTYGRGVGYMNEAKCEEENKDGCEKVGLLHYPKCKEGFKAVGCCICAPAHEHK